jgi:hypothetical protein
VIIVSSQFSVTSSFSFAVASLKERPSLLTSKCNGFQGPPTLA